MNSKTVTFDNDEVCLVTGGAGFIGSYLVRELANQGKKVIVFDFNQNASYIADCFDKITYVYGDVADMPHLMSVIADHGVELIFHLGYMLVPDSDQQMGSAIQTNCVGFHNVMEAARIAKVRRVVWASSQAVMGQADFYPPGPVTEDMFVNPTLVYGACKLFNEHVARFFRTQHNLDNIGFRKSVVYGLGKSRLRDISIAHLLVENAVLGRMLQVPPVDYHANFVYVKDIARAYLLAAQAPPTDHLIFNVGGFVYQNSEAVEVLKKLIPGLTVHQQVEYTLSHPIEVFAQDQSRASDEFGYEPAYTLEEGVKDYIKMFEEMGEQYKSAWSAYEVTPLP